MSIQWATSTRLVGSLVTVMTAELNGLASGSGVASPTQSNDDALERDRFADVELAFQFSVAPAADLTLALYIRRSLDGTNFEDASGARPPVNGYVGAFPVASVTTAQRIIIPGVVLPPGDFQWFVVNNCGQSLVASGNVMRVLYYTEAA